MPAPERTVVSSGSYVGVSCVLFNGFGVRQSLPRPVLSRHCLKDVFLAEVADLRK